MVNPEQIGIKVISILNQIIDFLKALVFAINKTVEQLTIIVNKIMGLFTKKGQ